MKQTRRFWARRRFLSVSSFWVGALLTLSFFLPTPAFADLRICNETKSRVGVAVGYHVGREWGSEGWFNMKPRACEIVFKGKLTGRYYYIFAIDYDRDGEWSGDHYLCTNAEPFKIIDVKDCYARGFERKGFFEIDTEQQSHWTVELGEGATSQ